tara:strand:- start:60 stop:1085 length:1026 start_codon:yes stop_codon:yes gene_type:complete
MAIVRQGIKIGTFDIRLGLPRDRGFDPEEASKRIKTSRPSGQSTLSKFRSMVSAGEGLARSNKFIVIINFPNTILDRNTFSQMGGSEFQEFTTASEFTTTLKNDIRERLFFFCDGASMPGRTIADETNDVMYGPERSIARGVTYDDVTLTFYMDQNMAEQVLFKSWQNLAISPNTYNSNYYDEYTGSIDIFPLIGLQQGQNIKRAVGQEDTADGEPLARATLGANFTHLAEAFPKTVAPIEMSYGNSGLAKLSVTFSYRFAVTPADLAVIGYGEQDIKKGSLRGDVRLPNEDIGRNLGVFGNLVKKLPPDLRRAGRDVINQARTRFPIGRIFGGRVFPPFF